MADKGLINASPEDQHAYLMDTDPGYARASSEDRAAYLKHLGVPVIPGMEKLGGLPPQLPTNKETAVGNAPIMRKSSPIEALTGVRPEKINKNIDQFDDTIKSDAAAIPGLIKSIPGAVRHPFNTMDKYLTDSADSQAGKYTKAKEQFKSGHYGDAALNAAGAAVPFVGPMAADIGEDVGSGNVGRAAARTGELYAGAKLGKVAGPIAKKAVEGIDFAAPLNAAMNVADNPYGALKAAVNAPFKNNPKVDALQAFDLHEPHLLDRLPGVENSHLESGLSDLKTHGGSPRSIEDVLTVAPKVKDLNRQAWDDWMVGKEGTTVHGRDIVKATEDSLKGTIHPNKKQYLLDEAKRIYDKDLTPQELYELLQEKNGELSGFYSKSEAVRHAAAQGGADTGMSQPLLEAQAKKIRDLLYNHLDPEGAGASPREIQDRYGAVSQLEIAAKAKRTAAEAEKPRNMAVGLGRVGTALVNTPGKIFKGNLEGALEGFSGPFRGKLDPQVQRAIEAAADATPFPRRVIPEPEPVVSPSQTVVPAGPVPTLAQPGQVNPPIPSPSPNGPTLAPQGFLNKLFKPAHVSAPVGTQWSLPPAISNSQFGIKKNIADFLKDTRGSVPLDPLEDIRKRIREGLHERINARNRFYHATDPDAASAILQSKRIKFGDPDAAYSQDPGVSVSRVPRIASKAEKAVSFIIDPEKTPANKPLAEPEPYQKTKTDYTYKDWKHFATPDEYLDHQDAFAAKDKAWDKYEQAQYEASNHHTQNFDPEAFRNDPTARPNYDKKMDQLTERKKQFAMEYDAALKNYAQMVKGLQEKYYNQVQNAANKKTMSKHFEFENRTKGKDIPVTAIKGIAIDESALDPGWEPDDWGLLKDLIKDETKLPKKTRTETQMDKLREQAKALGIPVHSFENGKKFNRYRANFLRTGPISKNLRSTSEVAS